MYSVTVTYAKERTHKIGISVLPQSPTVGERFRTTRGENKMEELEVTTAVFFQIVGKLVNKLC